MSPPKGYLLALMELMFRNQFGYELDLKRTRAITIDMRPMEATIRVTLDTVEGDDGALVEGSREWHLHL
jgi:hypothetical protein